MGHRPVYFIVKLERLLEPVLASSTWLSVNLALQLRESGSPYSHCSELYVPNRCCLWLRAHVAPYPNQD